MVGINACRIVKAFSAALWTWAWLAVSLSGCATAAPTNPADIVFRNGFVYTVDAGQPWASAVVSRRPRRFRVVTYSLGANWRNLFGLWYKLSR